MDMDHLIGQRFNLISKSEIRYVGTLHEINPEQSTIALEDVFSYGTEDRKVDRFIPPSQQKFDYIVFRGSDVKDIKIADESQEQRQPSPPSMPNDPAILNSSRPGPSLQGPPVQRGESPFQPPGFPPQPQFGGYYPPPQFNRGFGPPPPGVFGGPGPAFPPYGPPPGYFQHPNQPFPQHPHRFQPPAPIGTPGQRSEVTQGNQSHIQAQPMGPVPTDSGPAKASQPTSELPVDISSPQQQPQDAPKSTAPSEKTAPPRHADSLPTPPSQDTKPTTGPGPAWGKTQTGPQSKRVTPAVPLTVNQKSFTPPVVAVAGPRSTANGSKDVTKPVQTQADLDEAARQAKEAVANAMAKINPQIATTKAAPPPTTASTVAIDALAKKVSEMTTSSTNLTIATRGRGGYRGTRSNFRGGSRKMEIPKSDYDFESANAKFNKEDLIKEAIASGSPVNEYPSEIDTEAASVNNASTARKNSLPTAGAPVYNKTISFFDNLSSETKDREEVTDGRAHPRQLRSDEFKKNVETFGQGNVDGGYRGRGRGYGRGGSGNYRGSSGGSRGYNTRGGQSGYRGRGRGGSSQQQQGSGGQMSIQQEAMAQTST